MQTARTIADLKKMFRSREFAEHLANFLEETGQIPVMSAEEKKKIIDKYFPERVEGGNNGKGSFVGGPEGTP